MTSNPLRARVEKATPTELKKLREAFKLKPLVGGASIESRLEVAFFETLDRARPKVAAGYLSYGAGLAAASLLMTPPTKAELVAGVRALGEAFSRLYSAPADVPVSLLPESEEALSSAERVLLARVADLAAVGKKPGEDPVRTGLKLGGAAALPALVPGLGWAGLAAGVLKASWDSDATDRLIRASLLAAGIGERLRLEAMAMAES